MVTYRNENAPEEYRTLTNDGKKIHLVCKDGTFEYVLDCTEQKNMYGEPELFHADRNTITIFVYRRGRKL